MDWRTALVQNCVHGPYPLMSRGGTERSMRGPLPKMELGSLLHSVNNVQW